MENLWAPWRMKYIEDENRNVTGCVFCEIIKENEDRKNGIIFRGEFCYLVLNKFPYNNGHLMIIPYTHADDLLTLNDIVQAECQQLTNKAIEALRYVYKPHGINLGMNMGSAAGAGIDAHIHYHVLPRWNGDTNFMPVVGGVKVISESLEDSFDKLKKAFDDLF